MRSCAFLILEAATISIALVIFRVFCTLRIFILISLVPGIFVSYVVAPAQAGARCLQRRWIPASAGMTEILERATFLPVFDGRFQRLLVLRGQVFLVFHGFYQRGVLALHVVAQRLVRGERLLHVDRVEVAVV